MFWLLPVVDKVFNTGGLAGSRRVWSLVRRSCFAFGRRGEGYVSRTGYSGQCRSWACPTFWLLAVVDKMFNTGGLAGWRRV